MLAVDVLCVVEIPMESRDKYEWDEERGLLETLYEAPANCNPESH